MSKNISDIDIVLHRLFGDRAFREQLRQNAAVALARYDLTPEQRTALARLQKQPVAAPKLSLPPRRHFFSLN